MPGTRRPATASAVSASRPKMFDSHADEKPSSAAARIWSASPSSASSPSGSARKVPICMGAPAASDGLITLSALGAALGGSRFSTFPAGPFTSRSVGDNRDMESAAPRRTRPAARAATAERDQVAAQERARTHQVAAERARTRAAARERQEAEQARLARLGTELPADRYLDREDSWLRFAQRVLELAEDPTVPLLERVRFASIFATGLDEFFSVRIAGRIRRMATGLPVEAASGESPSKILEHALELARELSVRHARCFTDMLLPDLAGEGIEILRWKELVGDEQTRLERLFKERIFPVLTPLAVDPAHPFPFISGMSLSLALMIADPRTGATMFARVKVPPLLPRFLTVAPN